MGRLATVIVMGNEVVPRLPELLDLLTNEAAQLLGAERASIFLLDENRSELTSQVALGSEDTLRFDARLGIAGAVALGGETIHVPDVDVDDRFYPGVDARTGFQTRSVLATPLTAPAGEILGVFEVLNKRSGAFSSSDQDVLEALARHAARAIDSARSIHELRRQNHRLRREAARRFSTEAIVGTNTRIQRIVQLIDEIRDTDVNVLITGETGTGKELLARAIHGSSPRAAGAFIALNCAALPAELVEAELFGVEKGVATGVDARPGKFEQANGGTLFLDEIGDLSAAAQAKILRALQERVVERVGGRQPIPVDVRVLSASNRVLDREAREGRFRTDLFYRLKVVHLEPPPLREIPEDIPLLASRLLAQKCEELGREPKHLSAAALRRLSDHDWPGNVRELENEMLRLAASVRRAEIREDDLGDAIAARPVRGRGDLKGAVEDLERRLIEEALTACQGNKAQAAKRLGLSRQGLLNKMNRFGLGSSSD
ncbi:MAG: sigma-54-dependent Fis family transcriptional regulator [Planctomycetota bacterium]|jgi:Nif-specific regulatory protein